LAKPEWGLKRICPSCATRYYDMQKNPPVCPNCGTAFDPEALLRSRRSRPVPVDDTPKKAVRKDDELPLDSDEAADDEVVDDEEAATEEVEEDAEEEVAEDDDALLEDASELGDDDMGEMIEGVEEGSDD